MSESEPSEDTGDADREGGRDSGDKKAEVASACWGYMGWERASR
jgi:hypothetical protein